jgi:chromosome segregation ATPase
VRTDLDAVQVQLDSRHEAVRNISADKEEMEHNVAQQHAEINRLQKELEEGQSRIEELQAECDEVRADRDKIIETRDEYRTRVLQIDEMNEHETSRYSDLIRPLLDIVSQCGDIDGESASETNITDHVRRLIDTLADKNMKLQLLENQVSQLTTELESCQAEVEKCGSNEQIDNFEQRLQKAEDELAAGDVLRDNLRTDKEKFLKFLEVISKTMSIDSISEDMGLDSVTDVILARAEQLVKNESSELVDRKTHIFNLHRKLKTMKDQLDSKDVHMELLRKKVVSLEERLSNRTEMEQRLDTESVRSRKLMKLAEKYKRELNEAHVEMRDLRARLLTTSELQAKGVQSDSEIADLRAEIERLETLR